MLDGAGAVDGRRRPALSAGPSLTDRRVVGTRLQKAYDQQRPMPVALDGLDLGRGRGLRPQQRRQFPATPAPTAAERTA